MAIVKGRWFLILMLVGVFYSNSVWGQRIVVYPEKNTLCMAYKIGGKNYILEDGDILYKGKKIAQTQEGCFVLPPRVCPVGKIQKMVFHPGNLYRYFKKTVPLTLTGKKMWRKRGQSRKQVVSCVPSGDSAYGGDVFTVKVEDYSQLHRLQNAIPYVANVQTENASLLKVVNPHVEDCSPNDTTCLVYSSYRAVTRNLAYKRDPYNRGRDLIRTPQQTLKDKGGDCEDLTGVLVSFLANLKVDSYVLMTKDHAYAMACGIAPNRLQQYVRKNLERSVTKSEKVLLEDGKTEAFYFGISGNNRGRKMEWQISAEARDPFNFLVVSGRVNSSQLRSKKFKYNKQCSGIQVTEWNVTCELGTTITIVASQGVSFPGIPRPKKTNPSNQKRNPVKFSLQGNYNLADINQVAVHYYALKKKGRDTYCVVLEPTAGADGYPGFSRVKNQWSIAVSPTTWEWFYLKNPLKAYQ